MWACQASRQDESKVGSLEEKSKTKLFIGNLDFRVTEYCIIKMFSPFGKILSEEYMWHMHGPKRGEPRGFAFVEFSKREEAVKAKESMNGKMAFGRPLVVRFIDEKAVGTSADTPTNGTEVSAAIASQHSSTCPSVPTRRAKIAAIQSKLKAMEQDGIENEVAPRKAAKMSN